MADSIAAIEKCVFEDKDITMEQRIHALDHNFEAEERMRQVEQDKNFYDNTGGGMTLSGGVNDSWEIIEKTAAFDKAHGLQKVSLLPYHSLGVSKKSMSAENRKRFGSRMMRMWTR